jgi:hypothetical protein
VADRISLQTLSDSDFQELVGKQLDRYQTVIARLSNAGLQVKTWCLSALAALTAVAAGGDKPEILVLSVAVLGVFGFLDAYYLSLERHFRAAQTSLAKKVTGEDTLAVLDLVDMDAPAPRDWTKVLQCAGSLAITPFYGAMAVLLGIAAAITV